MFLILHLSRWETKANMYFERFIMRKFFVSEMVKVQTRLNLLSRLLHIGTFLVDCNNV